MVDPATAMLIATAIQTAVKAGGEYFTKSKEKKASKRKAKETKRETQANLLEGSLQRSSELEGHRLASRKKLGKRKAQSMQDTSDLVRGALNI